MNHPLSNDYYTQPQYLTHEHALHSPGFSPAIHFNHPNFALPHQQHAFPPLATLTSLSINDPPPIPRKPTCPCCKSQKYNFTSYFHNKEIFAQPPHEILPWVERAYGLKNRLQSLLVTYAVHEIDREKDVVAEIEAWGRQVECFVQDVRSYMGHSERVGCELGVVVEWMRGMVVRLREHVLCVRQLPTPKGRVKDLVLEFRKKWESVWVAYSEEMNNGRMGLWHGCFPVMEG